MNRLKLWAARRFFGELFDGSDLRISDASTASRESAAGSVKRLGIRNGDITSKDFEEPEFDMSAISDGYNTDSYIRQGVDKYVDQIFKEGYKFYGDNPDVVDYLKLRFAYMAEATGIPTDQLMMDIAEDVVKYGNCIVLKSRAKDMTSLPPTLTITGLDGKQPVSGYFPINVTTVSAKRDTNGTITSWQQEVGEKTVKFKPEDVVHFYYKREKGNAFGTSFLIPVLDDVRALRQAEENVLRMMYRNIYPFYHVAVGDSEAPGSDLEIETVQSAINDMDVDGGLVTTNRVAISPIASNQVINAEPYLQYLEERVFSGMGIPAIMFGRGDTANRSTGDNMASEMSDRIHAIQHSIEMFMNEYIVKELLMEGGYDPVLNPEDAVEFRFKENDLDAKVKSETHAVYLYEHNAITEDEMREELGRDPITDRGLMHQALITQANVEHEEQVKAQYSGTTSSSSSSSGKSNTTNKTTGTKETDNKVRPTNQHGTKTSPKRQTNHEESLAIGLIKDELDDLKDELVSYFESHTLNDKRVESSDINRLIDHHKENSLLYLDTLKLTEAKKQALTDYIDQIFKCDDELTLSDAAQALPLIEESFAMRVNSITNNKK